MLYTGSTHTQCATRPIFGVATQQAMLNGKIVETITAQNYEP